MSLFDFKNFNPEDCLLEDHKIDLWFLSLEAPFPSSNDILNEEEQERASRFHFPRHQRRFTNARSYLKLILSRYLDCDPSLIEFMYTKHGKPFIKHPRQLEFNISHTGEWALLAIGKKQALGVDIESYSARPYQGIAGHLYSASEQTLLQTIDPINKPWLFFNIWSQKEAFIKACGLGLFYPTQEFSVNLEQLSNHRIIDKLHDSQWQIRTFMPRVALAAALCHHPDITDIRYLQLMQPEKYLKP